MIPIRLAVEGLYSYEQRQEVDFRPLIGSGLFGIFGQVGSGKTSLLEAISFVLYGASERLNGRDNRAYNMMNLRASRMRIEFEFRAGADDAEYRYVFEAKRTQKKHHEVKPGDRQVYRRGDDGVEWMPQPIEKMDIGVYTQAVLGLDYDNFKRTIIIPQNQFREFLELSPADRTQMMSRLFDLNRYDLAGPTATLDKANQTELDNLTGQLSSVEAASPDAVEAARTALDAMDGLIRQQADRLKAIEADENRLLHRQQRHKKLAEARADLHALLTEQADMEQLAHELDLYERADRAFRNLLAQLDQLTKKQHQLAEQQQPAVTRLTDLEHQLPALQQASDTALNAFKNRHRQQEIINELAVIRLIRFNQQTIRRDEPVLLNLQKQAARQATQIQQRTDERGQKQTLADELGQRTSRLDELRAMQRWFERDKVLAGAVEKIEEKIETYEANRDAIKRRKDQALRGFPDDWAALPLKDLPPVIETARQQLRDIQQQREATHADNSLKKKLQEYADALTEGKPCPLCGAVHHPAVQQDTDIDAVVEKSGQALQKVTARLDEMTALLTNVREFLGELRTVHSQGKELINEKAEAVTQRTTHGDAFIWPDFLPTHEAVVLEAIRQETAGQQQLMATQKAIEELTRALETDRATHSQTEREIATLTASLAGLTQLATDQLGQLTHFRPEEVAAFDLRQIDSNVQELERQFARTETEFDRADRALTEAQTQHTRYLADIEQLTRQQADLQRDHNALTASLTAALTQHNLTRPAVEIILLTNLDLTTGRQQVQAFTVNLTIARTKTDDLTTELADQPFDPAELHQVQTLRQTARAEHNETHRLWGERTEAATKLRDQWAQKQILQQRFDELSLRQDDLKELKELFRGAGFARYVSTVYLNDLCQAANDRFSQLTNNQLRLEFEDDNFIVRDFLNGGKTRLAKTLSGGQMFQAALSLALALSDNIQHLTRSKQSLFFMDEGFGTLDKAALQTVFETLKSLRRENRIVGIISHVEELQQEIDTHIRTIRTDSGSRIECSWES